MKKLLFIPALCVFILGIYFIHTKTYIDKSISKPNPSDNYTYIRHSSHIFDPQFFIQAYNSSEHYQKKITGDIQGGIIPHHLTAAPLIAGFFKSIEKQKVNTIILLSPNHHGLGKQKIATSKGTWDTAFGELYADTAKINELLKEKAVYVNEEIFDTEHGIYAITPFIKKTFPDARLVPLVIQPGTSMRDFDSLAMSLYKIIDANTIVIASSDFSHYLSSREAEKYDKETISAILSYDTDRVLHLNHTKNLDSPESVYTLLKVMQHLKAAKSVLIANTNSAILTRQVNIPSTTSYAVIYFGHQKKSLITNDIFMYVDPAKASMRNENPNEYTIIATGDIIPARTVNIRLTQLNNFHYPFEKTVDLLKNADGVFVNLEAPLTPECQMTNEGMIFCGDMRFVQGLSYAGVDVAGIANNHAGNYGSDGINSTVQVLQDNNIQVTGNNQPAILKIKNKKFGFLAYNSIGNKEKGIAFADAAQIGKDLANLKKQCDFIIVGTHWGTEYTYVPNSDQITLGHIIVDAGADLVIGNHPHFTGGIEEYNRSLIVYSHGNFIFDQMWSKETREGIIGKYTFSNEGLKKTEFIPVVIEDFSQPRYATEKEAIDILGRMRASTEAAKL